MARVKAHDAIYHIMNRSMSEFNLFRDDDDKEKYLNLLQKYCHKNRCLVLAYCLMDTHLHLHLDPQGYDISKLMHGINLVYAQYYNRKYDRKGHVFQSRFESKITASDKYMLAVSAYIHNNPGDIAGYRGREHEYPYSSLGIYLGIREDERGMVNTDIILGLLNERDMSKAQESYMELVEELGKETDEAKRIKKCLGRLIINEYRSERTIILREIKPERVVDEVRQVLGISSKECIHIKYDRKFMNYRAFTAFILRTLSGLSYREICGIICNISLSGAAELHKRGYGLLLEGGVYRTIYDNLILLEPAA